MPVTGPMNLHNSIKKWIVSDHKKYTAFEVDNEARQLSPQVLSFLPADQMHSSGACQPRMKVVQTDLVVSYQS
jgi:hypothetical protein